MPAPQSSAPMLHNGATGEAPAFFLQPVQDQPRKADYHKAGGNKQKCPCEKYRARRQKGEQHQKNTHKRHAVTSQKQEKYDRRQRVTSKDQDPGGHVDESCQKSRRAACFLAAPHGTTAVGHSADGKEENQDIQSRKSNDRAHIIPPFPAGCTAPRR